MPSQSSAFESARVVINANNGAAVTLALTKIPAKIEFYELPTGFNSGAPQGIRFIQGSYASAAAAKTAMADGAAFQALDVGEKFQQDMGGPMPPPYWFISNTAVASVLLVKIWY